MSQIARDLGMRKSNLYYYFKSKEEILFASHLLLMEELSRSVEEAKASNEPADKKLRVLLKGFVHIVVDDFNASALTHNVRGMTKEHQEEIIALRDRFEAYIRFLIQQGINDGIFREMNIKLVGFAIFGAINWIHRWHDEQGPSSSSVIAEEFADFFISGLKSVEIIRPGHRGP